MNLDHIIIQIFGTTPIEIYVGGFFFTLVLVLFMKGIETKKRMDATDVRTPSQWSFIFMVVDNLKDIIQILTITFLLFRFSESSITARILVIDPETDLMLYAVAVGFLSTHLIKAVQKLQDFLGKKVTDKMDNWK